MPVTWNRMLACLQILMHKVGPSWLARASAGRTVLRPLSARCCPCTGLLGLGSAFAHGDGCTGVCAIAAFGSDAPTDLGRRPLRRGGGPGARGGGPGWPAAAGLRPRGARACRSRRAVSRIASSVIRSVSMVWAAWSRAARLGMESSYSATAERQREAPAAPSCAGTVAPADSSLTAARGVVICGTFQEE